MMIAAVFVFALIVLLGTGRAMPPVRSEQNGQATQYEQLYRSYLDPLELYHETPAQYSPVFSRGRNRWSNLQRYTDLVQSHDAYINPRAGDALNSVMLRALALTTSSDPPTQAQQRSFVSLLEDVGRQARDDLQIALHPENVAAQHRAPLKELKHKYTRLLGMLQDPTRVERLTSQLDEYDRQRLLATHEVLAAEKELLGVAAKAYAARLPRF